MAKDVYKSEKPDALQVLAKHAVYLQYFASYVREAPESRAAIERFIKENCVGPGFGPMLKWLDALINGDNPFSFSYYIDAKKHGLNKLLPIHDNFLLMTVVKARESEDCRRISERRMDAYCKEHGSGWKEIREWYYVVMSPDFAFPFYDYINVPEPTLPEMPELSPAISTSGRNLVERRQKMIADCDKQRRQFDIDYDNYPRVTAEKDYVVGKNARWFNIISRTNIKFVPRVGPKKLFKGGGDGWTAIDRGRAYTLLESFKERLEKGDYEEELKNISEKSILTY